MLSASVQSVQALSSEHFDNFKEKFKRNSTIPLLPFRGFFLFFWANKLNAAQRSSHSPVTVAVQQTKSVCFMAKK